LRIPVLTALLIVLPGVPSARAAGPAVPTNLKSEYLTDPPGIDVRQPRFGWVLAHSERGQVQTAYQVLVATRPEALARNEGDQWDSGRVASEESTQVVYAGRPLVSGRTYWWKVRWWDAQGSASPWGGPARFEMGLLDATEWKGQWIAGGNLLRKEFKLEGRVSRARAYVTALGYYELRLNGEKIGDHVLDPGWTTYEKRILYSTYDVTALLRPGANALGAMLGNGWAVPPARFGPPIVTRFKSPAFLLQLNIELEGGKTISVVSDTTWKATHGPVVEDSIFDGEVYDARLEQPDWDMPGFNDASWTAAQPAASPGGELSAQMMPPIRIVETLVPREMTSPKPGVYVFDLGQNISGWARLRVSGPRGAEVKMRFSELIYENGMINRENIRRAKAEDNYILKGEGTEVWEPRFTYHGFRYVEVTGFPGTPSLDSIRGRVVHTDVRTAGSFSAAHPLLNQIQRIIRWGYLTNLHSVPTDCPQRDERMGWMGDAHVTAEMAMLNFDTAAVYANFLRNIRDIQGEDGTVTDTVPHKYGSRPADPAWGTAYPLLVWYMYERYGDRRILDEYYEGVKKYVEFLRSRAPDHVLRFYHYGDWIAVEKTPGEFVSAAYFYANVELLRNMAELLGRSADVESYKKLSADVREALNKEFYSPRAGDYANGTQTANALALYFGLVPADQRARVMTSLVNNIVYRHDTHLTTGFIGIKYLMRLLSKAGRSDLAYELATRTTYPSWGYMIERGATTLWELWQEKLGPSMNSHNHPMLGSVGYWFISALGGITPDSPGYRTIRLAPQMARDLGWASATTETVRGRVSCAWKQSPTEIRVDVSVPVNATAQVVIPKNLEMREVTVREGDRPVWEKGRYVAGVPGVTGASQEGGAVRIEVGSGSYNFHLAEE
jgi:alpha-L-rhamnosidase